MTFDRHSSDAARIDLTRLSEQECEVLALLAKGHTAKSIAAQTGRSVASINERLRQARRKTGASSSRELARLLTARKGRDEEIDLSGDLTIGPIQRSRHIYAKGALVMGSLFAVAVAAAVLVGQSDSSSSTRADPGPTDALIDKILAPAGTEPRSLAERVRSESRDEVWAERAEAALRARYAPLVKEGRIKVLRIVCASTVCEMTGVGLEKDIRKVNLTWRDLQDGKRNELPAAAHVKNVAMAFGKGGFAAYWVRED